MTLIFICLLISVVFVVLCRVGCFWVTGVVVFPPSSFGVLLGLYFVILDSSLKNLKLFICSYSASIYFL